MNRYSEACAICGKAVKAGEGALSGERGRRRPVHLACKKPSTNLLPWEGAGMNLIESAVWDALKNSKCPDEHRYKGPSGSLPCRWCRAAHAVIRVLQKMQKDRLSPKKMLEWIQRLVPWTLDG